MPNKELVKKIKKMYEDDKDEDAIQAIRSLLLKDHLSEASFKKDAVIGTVDNGTVLANPAEVGKLISKSKKTIIVTKKGAYATIVFGYNGASVPVVTEGASGGFIPVGTMSGGAVDNENAKLIKKHTLAMIDSRSAKSTISNFFKGVCFALSTIKEDKERFNKAKFYLAENPVLSWFFLTLPGTDSGLVKGAELKDFDFHKVSGCADHMRSAMEANDYTFDKSIMRQNKTIRGQLQAGGNPKNLATEIEKAYKDNIAKWKDANIDNALKKNVSLKLLMDELRFMYESSVSTYGEIDDAISHLGSIDWNTPEKALVICDKKIYASLKSPEAFASGPIKFLQSIYFMYVPLSNTVTETLGGMQGGAEDANPSNIRNVIYSGGAARKQMYSGGDKFDAKAMLRLLTPAQLEELKAAL